MHWGPGHYMDYRTVSPAVRAAILEHKPSSLTDFAVMTYEEQLAWLKAMERVKWSDNNIDKVQAFLERPEVVRGLWPEIFQAYPYIAGNLGKVISISKKGLSMEEAVDLARTALESASWSSSVFKAITDAQTRPVRSALLPEAMTRTQLDDRDIKSDRVTEEVIARAVEYADTEDRMERLTRNIRRFYQRRIPPAIQGHLDQLRERLGYRGWSEGAMWMDGGESSSAAVRARTGPFLAACLAKLETIDGLGEERDQALKTFEKTFRSILGQTSYYRDSRGYRQHLLIHPEHVEAANRLLEKVPGLKTDLKFVGGPMDDE